MRLQHIVASILAAGSITGGTLLAATPAHAADACGTYNSDYAGHEYSATALGDVINIAFDDYGILHVVVHESTGTRSWDGTYSASPETLTVTAGLRHTTDYDTTVFRGCDGDSSTPGILVFRDIQAPFVRVDR